MGIRNLIGAIASAHQRNKTKPRGKEEKEVLEPDHTGFVPYTKGWKEKHLEWANAGLCGECGEPSGDELGICNECRWS